MTRTTSTVLTIALTAVFVFALSLAALAAPYAPADAPPGTSYGPLQGGLVEDAGQPAVVDPATAPQPAVVTPAPATDDSGTIILVASIVTGLFLAATIGGYVVVTARHRRAAHA